MASIFATASRAWPGMRLLLFSDVGLVAGSWDGHLHLVGQWPAVAGADRALGSAVRGDGQHDSHIGLGARLDGDLPLDVLARLQPPSFDHLAPGHRESVLLQRRVAEVRYWRLAEPQLEDERVGPVVGLRHAVGGGPHCTV